MNDMAQRAARMLDEHMGKQLAAAMTCCEPAPEQPPLTLQMLEQQMARLAQELAPLETAWMGPGGLDRLECEVAGEPHLAGIPVYLCDELEDDEFYVVEPGPWQDALRANWRNAKAQACILRALARAAKDRGT